MYNTGYTQLNIPNPQNPFPCNLAAAQQEFFQTLLQVQQQKQKNRKRILKKIERDHDALVQDLNEQWNDLEGLARDGLVDRVTVQLNNFMKDYGRQKALYQFLDRAASGWNLSPQTPGLQEALANKLERKHQQLSSLLVQALTNGKREREEANARKAEPLANARIQFAEQSMEREYGRNRELYQLVMTALGKLDEQAGKTPQVVREAHDDARKSLEDARKSLELAMKGAQQVQDVFPMIMNPAVKLVESANDLVKSNNQHLQQQLPSYMEEAVVRADKRRRNGKLFWFAISLAALIGLPLFAFLLLQFL